MSQVTSQLDDEFQLPREAFIDLIGLANPGTFSSPRSQGVHDGNEGVQWSCWIERDESGSTTRYFSVNLEGKEYDGWPIARLIQHELEQPAILEARSQIEHPELIEVHLTRDAWGPLGSRISGFKEYSIPPTPMTLDRITGDGWRSVLEEAHMGMKTSKGGRAILTLTKSSGQTSEQWVSPHLNVRQQLTGAGNPEQLQQSMREAQQNLLPVYNWVRDRARKYARPPLPAYQPTEEAVKL